MTADNLEKMKKILAEISNPRLRRTLVPSEPYPKKKLYQETLRKIGRDKLAKMLRVLSILVQTKVYLFWEKQKSARDT